ncbi:MAG: carboxypeptidase-like regulatory domain-containing protein, partial [Chitinophagaceae bacterium]
MRFFLIYLLFPFITTAQNKTASISGTVVDEDGKPLVGATIEILNKNKKTLTNTSGYFKLEIPANKIVAIIISFNGYIAQQRNLQLNSGEEEIINIRLDKNTQQLQEVIVKNDRQTRGEIGRIVIDPNKAIVNPSPNSSIENLLKFFTSPTGELTSQYNVRGGSFDENLIYVNDFEVFRPYLIRNGQQEGLSFINPELTSNVKFYNGGFQAKYGDKMSSALDIT